MLFLRWVAEHRHNDTAGRSIQYVVDGKIGGVRPFPDQMVACQGTNELDPHSPSYIYQRIILNIPLASQLYSMATRSMHSVE